MQTHVAGPDGVTAMEQTDKRVRSNATRYAFLQRVALLISESEELGACFVPTTDRPQRSIESAARLDTNTEIADLIPDVGPTPLQQRIQRAFFLLRKRPMG